MVSRKTSTGTTKKLKIKKETIKNLDPDKKAKDVKGGRAGPNGGCNKNRELRLTRSACSAAEAGPSIRKEVSPTSSSGGNSAMRETARSDRGVRSRHWRKGMRLKVCIICGS